MPDSIVLSQSWKILPVPGDRTGRPEGLQILDEMGDQGTIPFRIYRTIRARAELGPAAVEGRKNSMDGTAPLEDAAVWKAVRALRCAYDPGADPRQISEAAEELATVLEARDLHESSAAFRCAAAAIADDDPAASHRAGNAMRRLSRYSEAEIWYDRTIILARQQRDWRTYVRTYIAYGRVHQLRGNNPRAERHFRRALRRARRQSLNYEMAMAAHDLMMIELDRAGYRKARRYAEIALEGYGSKNCGLLRLTHDIGWQYLETGYPTEAAGVFTAILEHCEDPQVQLTARANLARAFGVLGEADRFRVLRDEVLQRAPTIPALHAVCLLEVAIGARSLGDYETSRHDASEALRIAEELSHNRTAFRARAVLDSLGAPAAEAAAPDRRPFIDAEDIVEMLDGVCGADHNGCGADVSATRQFAA